MVNRKVVLAVVVVVSPVILALGILWTFLGWLLSLKPFTLWALLSGFLWMGYALGAREAEGGAQNYLHREFVDYSFRSSLGDLVLLTCGVMLVLLDPFKLLHGLNSKEETQALVKPVGKEQSVWGVQPVPVELAFATGVTVFAIVKAAMYRWTSQGEGDETSGLSRSQQFVIAFVILALWLCVAQASHFWIPTSMCQLAAAEQRLRQLAGVETTSGMVGRVHTIAVGNKLLYKSMKANPQADPALISEALKVGATGDVSGYGTMSDAVVDATGLVDAVQAKNKTRRGPAPASKRAPPLVLLHGFGMGAAAYYKTLKGLAPHFEAVYSLDWLGVGLSERPRFPAHGTPEQVADWFADALEEWREQMGLPSFVLAGHSLGAIISIAYASKHPDRVEQLCLLSPASGRQRQPTGNFALIFKVVRFFWSRGFTPQGLVRWIGPAGPAFVRSIFRYRYGQSNFTPDELELFSAYTYHNWAHPGSGEYALNSLLAPGVIPRLELAPLVTPARLKNKKLTVIYGGRTRDWMDPTFGEVSVDTYKEQGGAASLHFVDEAGHQLILDAPEEFCNMFVTVTRQTAASSAPDAAAAAAAAAIAEAVEGK